jgi:hypothetical protein
LPSLRVFAFRGHGKCAPCTAARVAAAISGVWRRAWLLSFVLTKEVKRKTKATLEASATGMMVQAFAANQARNKMAIRPPYCKGG